MVKSENKLRRSRVTNCEKKSLNKNRKCNYPSCNKTAINSHILQNNGVLDRISKDSHLWHIGNNIFSEEIFLPQRKGMKAVFTFPGFCATHDPELFESIEQRNEIDFDKYQHCLLLTVRAWYNEYYRKIRIAEVFNCILKDETDEYNRRKLEMDILGANYSIGDFKKKEEIFWNDILRNQKSMVFMTKMIPKLDIVLASFFDYENTIEVNKLEMLGISEEVELSPIFISTFPVKDESAFIIGYFKKDEPKVKGYANSIFKEKGKRLLRRLSNILLFQCENWVCSEEFYQDKIKGIEVEISKMIKFGLSIGNERKNPNANIFGNRFEKEISNIMKNGS